MTTHPIYKRILLKLSGEALQGSQDFGFDSNVLDRIVSEIKELSDLGVQVGIVVGGGNLFRGAQLAKMNFSRVVGDHMGMLATVMNGLAVRESLIRHGGQCVLMSSLPLTGVCESYNWNRAVAELEKGRVVIFSGGTGNPFFTTDSAACLRGIEVSANIILKATNVDGIYDSDPRTNPQSKRFSSISYQEVIEKELKVMDLAAFTLARDHKMPIKVFSIHEYGNLIRAVTEPDFGTVVE